jgi:hypothetical protein
MPLYTRILTNADFGVADLIIQTANLIIPVASLGITNAIFVSGLIKASEKAMCFQPGDNCCSGFCIFLAAWPL